MVNVTTRMSSHKRASGQSMAASKDTKIAELKVALLRRKTLESKALSVVQSLIDNPVSAEQLSDCCRHISLAHYEDIVQERALILNCGYPLCSQRVVQMPKKTFHISVKYNKVFDITERKNFCSNHCFKASKHLESQLKSSSVWLTEDVVTECKISFLSADDKVEIFKGTVVDFGPVTPVVVEDSTPDDYVEMDETRKVGRSIKDGLTKLTVKSGGEERRTIDEQIECAKSKDDRVTVDRKQAKPNALPRQTPLLLVEKCLKEWFTLNSIEFLLDQCDDRAEVHDKPTVKKFHRSDEDYDLKVQSFYNSQFAIPIKKSESISELQDDKAKPVLPLVDSTAQNALRRRIVLDKLNLVSTELFRAMRISSNEVKVDLRLLIHTFRLKSTNISLKPAEWSVITILLLQLLTSRNNAVREAFATESSIKFLNILLTSFGQDVAYLQRMAEWLMNEKHLERVVSS